MDALIEEELDLRNDFRPELPCEGTAHAAGTFGHVAASPGAYLLTSPCCRRPIVHCAPRIAAMRFLGVVLCARCGTSYDFADYDLEALSDV